VGCANRFLAFAVLRRAANVRRSTQANELVRFERCALSSIGVAIRGHPNLRQINGYKNVMQHFAPDLNCSILLLRNRLLSKLQPAWRTSVIDPKKTVLFLICVLVLSNVDLAAETKPEIKKQAFGKTSEQEPVEIYTLTNANGAEAR